LARAQDSSNSSAATTNLNFAAWVENGEMIGDEQARRLYMAVGSTQLGLIVPSGMRVDLAKADRVTLAEPALSYFMTLRIIGNFAGGSGARNQALQQYPGAAVTEESSAEAFGARYPMFHLRWKPASGVDRVVLVSFVPSGAGTVECTMVAEETKASEAQNTFIGVLQRLQAGERGKLQMPTVHQLGYN